MMPRGRLPEGLRERLVIEVAAAQEAVVVMTIEQRAQITAALATRDNLICEARKAGVPAAELAKRTGLNVSRIRQILATN